MFTPRGLSVRLASLAISVPMTWISPEDVSMMPEAPALEMAAASWDRAIQPIGACTMGPCTPSMAVTGLSNCMVAETSPPRPRSVAGVLADTVPAMGESGYG